MAYRTPLSRETKIRVTICISASQFIDTMSNVSDIAADLILWNDAVVVCDITTISISLPKHNNEKNIKYAMWTGDKLALVVYFCFQIFILH